MTELNLYLQCIPMIAELVIRFQNLSDQQYKDWKRKTMEAAPDTVKEFLGKVFIVISAELKRTGKAVR